jgi:HEPN domain-containing protein
MHKPENNQENGALTANPSISAAPELLRLGLDKIMAAQQSPAVKEHQAWLSRLTPEELKIYNEIGFRFQLMRSLLTNAHLIALPAGHNDFIKSKETEKIPKAPFSWEEFMKMLDEIREEAEKFLGREIERTKSRLFKNFTAFYHRLCELGNPIQLKNPNHNLSAALIEAIKEMPKVQDFNTLSFRLNLNVQEEIIFKSALKKLKQLYTTAKSTDIQNAAGADESVTANEIHEIAAELGKLECLRRIGTRDQKGPLDEYKNLINYINTWKKSFEDISGIINDKTAEVFRTMAGTIAQSFPDAIMPATYRHHRDVIGHRVHQYKKLTEIINGIEDQNHKTLTKKIVFQIGIILSYLDFLWDMHETVDEHGGQKIIYPKSMLMIAPLISNETGKLIKNLQNIADSQKCASICPPANDENDEMEDLFNIDEDSQPGIAVTEFGPTPRLPSIRPGIAPLRAIFSEEINTMLFTSLPEQKKSPNDYYKNITPTLEFLVSYLTRQMRDADKALRLTIVKKEAKYETLSPDIQTFQNSLQESLLLALVEVARIFEPNINKNDIIPEFIDFEDQSAELRIHLHNLGDVVENVGKNLDSLDIKSLNANPGNAPVKTKIELLKLMEAIEQFHVKQNACMEQSKYHATLIGHDFEMVNGFMVAISNYFIDGGLDTINKNLLAEYTNIRELDELAKACSRSQAMVNLPKNESVNNWLVEWNELKKIENELDRAMLEGRGAVEPETRYRTIFLSLIAKAKAIAQDTAENEGGDNFKEFAKNNPDIFIHNYLFEPKLFKFTGLMKQFSDFRSIFGMKSQIGNAPLLAEHDLRIKNTVHDALDIIISTAAFNDFSQTEQNAINGGIKQCRINAPHLQFIAPELVNELYENLKYLESYIAFAQQHGHKIDRSDLEDIFTGFRKIQARLK